jgi:tetratricopeptide (TPR) repeat protein
MNILDLKDAVVEIQQACDETEDGDTHPFFFIIGAGLSAPSIPLAGAMVQHFQEKAKKYGKDENIGKDKTVGIDEYDFWFNQAYPQRIDRQRYLRKMIKDQTISHANLRLAHLLLNGRVANIVVTPNFDDFISRALLLFGKQHIISDHPKTIGRINPEVRNDIQIIHVHGTYWFYDCCNLREEIQDRAQTKDDDETVSFKLDQILKSRSPLILGYSGWEGDVIMSALGRRLRQAHLPRRIYWFCYQKENIDSLPDEIKNHSDVWFVIPPEQQDSEVMLESKQLNELSNDKVKKGSEHESKKNVLPAQKVLELLIETMDLKPPELTSDPLIFLAKQLKAALPQTDGTIKEDNIDENDLYRFEKVIERIEKASQREKEDLSAQKIDSLFEEVRNAVRSSQYKEAIKKIAAISTEELNDKQLKELLDTAWSAALNLYDSSVEELKAYDLVLDIGSILESRGKINSALRKQVAKALVNKGVRLGELNRKEEEIQVYDDVIKRFSGATEPALREQVANALFNKGVSLGQLNRNEEAIQIYDDVVKQFGETTELILREQVVKALVNKGASLGQLNRKEEELQVYDDVVKRFSGATELALHEAVAKALVNKGITLGELNRNKKAIQVYDDVVKQFSGATKLTLREQVVKALFNKGILLSQLNRNAEAIQVYDDVVKQFGETTELTLRERVADALNGIGFAMICESKRVWQDRNEEQARDILSKSMEKVKAALEIKPNEPVILGNLGYIHFLQGNIEEAHEFLNKAIALGGEEIRQGELADADIHSLPQDEDFRALIHSIPIVGDTEK